MKYVPNTLSISRLIIAVILLFGATVSGFIFARPLLPALGLPFMLLYIFGGITDLFDGPIARRYNVASEWGSNLDGIADITFIVVALITIIPAMNFQRPFLILWLIAGFVTLYIIGVIHGYARYRQLMMMHTRLSRAAALIAWTVPIIYWAIPMDIYADVIIYFLVAYVYFYQIEILFINSTMPYPKRHITSIFEARRLRREYMESNS
jgi:CDP-diacylglycerol--glycerol-3-phosphate 3-phosphatidyltransferase